MVVLVVMVDGASVILGSFSASSSVMIQENCQIILITTKLEILEKCKKDIKNQHNF